LTVLLKINPNHALFEQSTQTRLLVYAVQSFSGRD